ncbi:MAG TPA: glycosyltransferase family 2 protein [Candidatus Saccharimonadales bacterium]|nr:glycosyltransferase family 2 protein [Candidatus Saccharimonadales bacterium]
MSDASPWVYKTRRGVFWGIIEEMNASVDTVDTIDTKVAVVVPNWNGADQLGACLDSLLAQSLKARVIVVDNGSSDGSLELLEKYPSVEVIRHQKNLGFTGGVNTGFKRAMELKLRYVAAFNNDAVADKHWLEQLVAALSQHPKVGIVTSKILTADGKKIDSTGDYLTVWGLPYPRGRGESDIDKYDEDTEIFGASGGASLYRVSMLEAIGLFDDDFFAYYEDVDLSFRAQLAGWQVRYEPRAVAYHRIGATSGKIKGFAAYQTMKNQQILLYKNLPRGHRGVIWRRFTLAHTLFLLRAISRGQAWPAIKGDLRGSWLILKKSGERRRIQKSKKVTDEYIWNMLVHDLPPNARALRKLRRGWWRLRGKQA